MRGSTERILTTHVGALPAPAGLWANKNVPDAELQQAVSGVVAKQIGRASCRERVFSSV